MNPQFYRSRPKPADVPTGRDYWIKADPDGVVRDLSTPEERAQKNEDAADELEELRYRDPVVDIGCGVGTLLWTLRKHRTGGDRSVVQPIGVEPDEWAATEAMRYTRCLVVNSIEALPAASFDGALCYHVIEHVAEPEPFVGEIHRILNRGGKLVISTPNFDSPVAERWGDNFRLLKDPTHISLFGTAGLIRLLEHVGFRVDRVWYPFPERLQTKDSALRLLDDPETTISPPAPGNIVSMAAVKV